MIITPPPKESSFAKLVVGDIMRRTMLTRHLASSVEAAISLFVKHKADALLVLDSDGMGVGVVTKTEIMTCYFSGLPLDTTVQEVMGGPVISCRPTDTLQDALLTMQDRHIHRIYVIDPGSGRTTGTLSYPDIVGVLYRYCCRCESSLLNRRRRVEGGGNDLRITVGEVMHRSVITGYVGDTIEAIIGLLASYHIGALLLLDGEQLPVGVLSKTDLALAYRRGVCLTNSASTIMHRSVMQCRETDQLEQAIRQMIFSEVSRLFVTAAAEDDIVGVITLTDAARARSGSCRACTNSRIIPKGSPLGR